MNSELYSEKKNILIITNIPAPYRVDMFRYLQNNYKKYQFSILFAAEGESNRNWKLDVSKLNNVFYHKCKQIAIKRKYDSKFIYLPGNISKIIRGINPEIVISWEYNLISLVAFFWCKIHRRKFISLTDGTLHSERNINILQKFIRKIIIQNCDSAIASSNKAKEKLEYWGICKEKIFISLLTEDLSPFKGLVRSPIVGRLLYVGSLIERKGLDLLFNALPLVQTEWHLNIVGNGTKEERQNLITLAKEKGINDKIAFMGFKSGEELIEEYKQAAVFVFPTREDCFGLVLLEAAAANIPIVTSIYADGAYDIISAKNGIFVDPNKPTEMANAIDLSLRKQSGESKIENIDIFQSFSFEATAKAFMNAVAYLE